MCENPHMQHPLFTERTSHAPGNPLRPHLCPPYPALPDPPLGHPGLVSSERGPGDPHVHRLSPASVAAVAAGRPGRQRRSPESLLDPGPFLPAAHPGPQQNQPAPALRGLDPAAPAAPEQAGRILPQPPRVFLHHHRHDLPVLPTTPGPGLPGRQPGQCSGKSPGRRPLSQRCGGGNGGGGFSRTILLGYRITPGRHSRPSALSAEILEPGIYGFVLCPTPKSPLSRIWPTLTPMEGIGGSFIAYLGTSAAPGGIREAIRFRASGSISCAWEKIENCFMPNP